MTVFDPARLLLPPEDRVRSPHTGWTREHWAAVADHLLLSLKPFFTPTRSQVRLPGTVSSSGASSDGLEAFARSFLLYAFRTGGEHGTDPLGFTDWYRDGLVAGTDPANPERWLRPDEQPQVQVEAASIALGLQLTRPWLWDTLDAAAQQRIVDWLALSPPSRYPDNNWLWFRITVETFLASVGGPHDPARVAADLARIEDYYQTDGWYADGAFRNYDYYCGWAMHLYPLLWAGSEGAETFGSGALAPVFRGRLADFLDDYAALVGADGLPVLQGRSLIYRFATAAPFWMGAMTGASRLSPGTLRRAASGSLRAFLDRGAIDARGLLSVGLYGEWPAMAQTYSGAGSPYWASKGFLGLLLPADHEAWTAVEEPLPVERGDVRRVIRPAGWLVSGTASDGIVRVFNHGADHAVEGDRTGDSTLYARFGYSSATLPPATGATIDDPADNMVGALDAQGRSTHRTGFARGAIGDDGTAAFATSTADAHWVDSSIGGPAYDHGSGREGLVTDGPRLATASVVRGAWEVRATLRLPREGVSEDPVRLRVSGWPLTGAEAAAADLAGGGVVGGGVVLDLDGLRSELRALSGAAAASAHTESGTSPIGETTSIPRLEFDAVAVGDVVIAAVRLGRGSEPAPSAVALPTGDGTVVLETTWPDGAVSTVRLG
ncbi:DUF2264 domain-containing protein [Microbacterium capsulatum]|uniref:DUF2264 domain-containing protein n=1 Tax=Microbacterium capsulatum TaxID=3041921 RepID=A0ABU0XKF8_9MICO|nr:DUF2264 domain-containing protein [Microbacterium sp. ASV81]MDQ4215627.1 DUF2264 domain-containing protein [Microbacterium sp. ASV81]